MTDFDMLAHANDILRRFAPLGTASPAMDKLTRPAPVQSTALDWTCDYLLRQLVGLTWMDARRIVAAVLEKRRLGKTLTDWESRVYEAWDRVSQEGR